MENRDGLIKLHNRKIPFQALYLSSPVVTAAISEHNKKHGFCMIQRVVFDGGPLAGYQDLFGWLESVIRHGKLVDTNVANENGPAALLRYWQFAQVAKALRVDHITKVVGPQILSLLIHRRTDLHLNVDVNTVRKVYEKDNEVIFREMRLCVVEYLAIAVPFEKLDWESELTEDTANLPGFKADLEEEIKRVDKDKDGYLADYNRYVRVIDVDAFVEERWWAKNWDLYPDDERARPYSGGGMFDPWG